MIVRVPVMFFDTKSISQVLSGQSSTTVGSHA